MSQTELDRTDQEVMELVNSAASPESKQNARAVEEKLKKPAGETKETDMERTVAAAARRIRRRSWWRKVKTTVLTVSICALLQAALLLVLFKPEWLIHLINTGMVITSAVAAVVFDRHRRGI